MRRRPEEGTRAQNGATSGPTPNAPGWSLVGTILEDEPAANPSAAVVQSPWGFRALALPSSVGLAPQCLSAAAPVSSRAGGDPSGRSATIGSMPTYHMRRTEREILDRGELERVLRSQRYMAVAMCRHGEPYVVTLSYGYSADERALYFHCARDGLKLDFLRENPRVCATAVEDLGYKEGECAHAYRSLVVRGEMRVVEDRAGKAHGLRVLLAHQEEDPLDTEGRLLPDDAAYERVTVLRLDIAEITGKRAA